MRIIGSVLDCSDKRKRNNTVSRKVVKPHCCNQSSWMWTLHSCFKLVELLVLMTTDHSWLNGVSMNNNWLLWCKGPVLRVLPMTLSTTSRDEIWYYKYWTNIIIICVPINKKFRGWRPVVGGAPGSSRESAAPNNGNVCIIILMYLM